MYRTIEIEKVGLGRVNAEVATTATGFAALGLFAKRTVAALRRSFERAAIARELAALDERELADIGLTRADIPAVAEQSVAQTAEPGLTAAFLEMVYGVIVAPVLLWNKRRAAFGALNSLDDRMLADIGVDRADIASVVKGMHKSVSYPAVSLDVVAPLAAWNRARQTANQLYRLEDRMLADIGVVRGDIEWLASEVANKAAANRNASTGPKPHAA